LEVDVIKQLLEAGADISVRDNKGRSILWHACVEWSQEVVDLLLKEGADIDGIKGRDRTGNTILHAVVTSKESKVDRV